MARRALRSAEPRLSCERPRKLGAKPLLLLLLTWPASTASLPLCCAASSEAMAPGWRAEALV